MGSSPTEATIPMPVIKPPKPISVDQLRQKIVFIAGSIEQGTAVNWQPLAEKQFSPHALVLNPRRDDWDAGLKQDITEPVFKGQVVWEMTGIDISTVVFFYFDPDTKSPITLGELYYCIGADLDCVVVCPPGFWRRGNVQVMCERYDVKLFDDLDEGMDYVVQNYLR